MLPAAALAADSCTALALSGGGSNGAWEVGVIWGLYHYGIPQDFAYDVITGVSAGSINTIAMAGWAPEDGVAMSEYLSYLTGISVSSNVWA